MRGRTKWRAWDIRAALGVALALGWTLGVGFARGFWTEQTAAWVQAIGSIAAILVAVRLGVEQAREQRLVNVRAWLQGKVDRAHAVLIIARQAHAKGQCAVIGPSADESGFVPAHFEALAASLAEIPLHTLGDEALVEAVIELRSAMETLIWNFHAGESELEDPDDQSEPGRRQDAVNAQVECIERCRDSLDGIVIRLIHDRDFPGR